MPTMTPSSAYDGMVSPIALNAFAAADAGGAAVDEDREAKPDHGRDHQRLHDQAEALPRIACEHRSAILHEAPEPHQHPLRAGNVRDNLTHNRSHGAQLDQKLFSTRDQRIGREAPFEATPRCAAFGGRDEWRTEALPSPTGGMFP